MSEGGLKLVYPCFVELVDLLDSDGIIVGLPVLECGENDDGDVAQVGDATGGGVDFRIAAATVGLKGAILRGGTCLSVFGLGRFHQLVTEGLCNGGVGGELRWHVDVLVARGKAQKAESRGDGGTPAEKLANEGRHAVDRSEHDRGLILIGIGGIDEDKTGDFGREAAGVYACEITADGMADENVGAGDRSALKEFVEVVCDGGAGGRSGRRIAPTFAGAVVPAQASELGNLGLDFAPVVAAITTETTTSTRYDDNGGRTFPGAIDVESTAANIDGTADAKAMLSVTAAAELLVGEANDGEERYEGCDRGESESASPAES
jgi:hypothetical protein